MRSATTSLQHGDMGGRALCPYSRPQVDRIWLREIF